jgi:hypothetical protein
LSSSLIQTLLALPLCLCLFRPSRNGNPPTQTLISPPFFISLTHSLPCPTLFSTRATGQPFFPHCLERLHPRLLSPASPLPYLVSRASGFISIDSVTSFPPFVTSTLFHQKLFFSSLFASFHVCSFHVRRGQRLARKDRHAVSSLLTTCFASILRLELSAYLGSSPWPTLQ